MRQLISMQSNFANNHVEESVDALLQKLEAQGKKVKIIDDDDDEAPQKGWGREGGGAFSQKFSQIEWIEKEKERLNQELNAQQDVLKAEQQQKQMMEDLLIQME